MHANMYLPIINKTIERYQSKAKGLGISKRGAPENEQHHLEGETVDLAKKIELLEVSKRRLLGECLDSCSIEELQQIENELEQSLSNIRIQKNHLCKGHIERLKEQERILGEENAKLRGKDITITLYKYNILVSYRLARPLIRTNTTCRGQAKSHTGVGIKSDISLWVAATATIHQTSVSTICRNIGGRDRIVHRTTRKTNSPLSVRDLIADDEYSFKSNSSTSCLQDLQLL
ncbi:Agamous-like MADS-box protein AGL19 [Vitis vinifera]|uniref:Agamous-like MADS-box protein AGL19 n=1 Tax=Vitis vinifera TaxID=29760 RepID=A0A438BZC0_VITVI|nr:Agamous-like MADS-box protein AGL19 [Vitis vinifera]